MNSQWDQRMDQSKMVKFTITPKIYFVYPGYTFTFCTAKAVDKKDKQNNFH